jgi:acetyl-CoA C-acetyltransferase
MALDPRTPIIVGVAQHVQRELSGAKQPGALMADAARAAADDAGAVRLVDRVDVVAVVESLSWRLCRNPGATLGGLLGAAPRRTITTTSGGNSPQLVVNHLALAISEGQCDVALVAGAETVHSRRRARREGLTIEEIAGRDDLADDEVVGDPRDPQHPAEVAAGLSVPLDYYPLLEQAVRTSAGRTPEEHDQHLAALWSRFSAVAAQNPYAWDRTPHSAAELRTDEGGNRMVALPYRKRMTSNIDVDQAAALLLCSVATAELLGIARDKWVFVHAGADANDHWFVSERLALDRSPAIRIAGASALGAAGCSIDDVALVDLYSCFPSAVQIAAHELGLTLDRELTVTGGLSFAGGPANSYVTHSIATMVDRLRAAPGSRGLCSALGWFATKHSFGVYGTDPPSGGFRHVAPQAEVDQLPTRSVAADHVGPVTIETATVHYDRDGAAVRGVITAITADGARCWATTADADLLCQLAETDPIGGQATRGVDGALALL